MLVSPKILGDCSSSTLTTFVNGEKRQQGALSDLVFGVKQLVAFCSRGQTLQAGSLIMFVTLCSTQIKETEAILQDWYPRRSWPLHEAADFLERR